MLLLFELHHPSCMPIPFFKDLYVPTARWMSVYVASCACSHSSCRCLVLVYTIFARVLAATVLIVGKLQANLGVIDFTAHVISTLLIS